MDVDRKSVLDYITDWIAFMGHGVRNVFAWSAQDVKAETAQSTDTDFDGWLANDPMVTLNPASRYGDDATGFLDGSKVENPELRRMDD